MISEALFREIKYKECLDLKYNIALRIQSLKKNEKKLIPSVIDSINRSISLEIELGYKLLYSKYSDYVRDNNLN